MSKLTDVLHELADAVGVNRLHEHIDALDNVDADKEKAPPETPAQPAGMAPAVPPVDNNGGTPNA